MDISMSKLIKLHVKRVPLLYVNENSQMPEPTSVVLNQNFWEKGLGMSFVLFCFVLLCFVF